MANYHHKPIKRFGLSGIIKDDSSIYRLKNEYIRLVTTEMRLAGYVPRLDIDIDFTIEYNEIKEYFSFELSLYGVFTGRKQSEWIDGIDRAKVLPTQKTKLEESLQVQG